MKSILTLAALFTFALPVLADDPPTRPAPMPSEARPPQSTLTPMPLAAPSAACAGNCGAVAMAGSCGTAAVGYAEHATVRSRVREVVRSRPVRAIFGRRRGGGCG